MRLSHREASSTIVGVALELSKVCSEILWPLLLQPSEQEFFRQLRFAAGAYSDFEAIVSKSPEIVSNLLEATNRQFKDRMKEPISSIQVALSTLGFLPARNFLASNLILGGGGGARAAGLLPGSPEMAEFLKYSLLSEKASEQGANTAEDRFIGGLVFDALRSRALKRGEDGKWTISKELETYISDVHKHSLTVAKNARKLAEVLVPHQALDKEVTLDGMLHDIGKVMLGVMLPDSHPTWAKAQLGSALECGLKEESSTYGLAHESYGYLVVSHLGFPKETCWITMYHHEPYLASRLGPTARTRATLVWLGDRLARYKEVHKKGQIDDSSVFRWFSACEAGIPGLTEKAFTAAVKGIAL